MGAHGQYPITLVTAYFNVAPKPGFSENPYPGWIRNFLPHVRWPLVIFCDEQSVEMIKEARGDKPAVWHVTRPEEFYAYRYLDDLKRLPFPEDQAEAHIVRSLIWPEKHHFLRQALSENPFGSEMLFWCDIGRFRYNPDAPLWSIWRWSFRLYEDIEWPNFEVCRRFPEDKVVLVAHDGKDIVLGGLFGGAIEPSRRWCDFYYQRLEKRKQNGDFTCIEELVMTGCLRRRREFAYVVPDAFRPSGKIGPKLGCAWYFLNGGRFPWKCFFRRLFSEFVR